MHPSARPISTPKALAPPGLSHAVQVGDLVFVSGQVGIVPGAPGAPAELQDEIEVAIDALEAVLDAAGCSLESVVKTTCYLGSIEDMEQFNAVYLRRFAEPRPARTTVQATLAMDLRFEIDAVAVIGH
jgi:2-iminobutanoate/2-iminopropanoate deaminase